MLLQDPCVYCGAPAHGLDHIVPFSLGGANSWWNRAPACVECDSLKDVMPFLVFLVVRQRMVSRGYRDRVLGEAIRSSLRNLRQAQAR